MIRLRSVASMTVIVSWPEFETKMRRPSGEATMFHGSEPVANVPRRATRRSTRALRSRALAFVILSTLTVPSAALAT